MLAHRALHEQRGPLRVDAHRHQRGRRSQRVVPQLGGVGGGGEGVEIDHAVHRVVLVLVGHPVAERAQQVAQVHAAGRLYSRKHASHAGQTTRPDRKTPRCRQFGAVGGVIAVVGGQNPEMPGGEP